MAAYIAYVLDCLLKPSTPLYHSEVTLDNVIDVITKIRTKTITFMPLDESAYDYNFPREAWQGFIMFLERTFGKKDFVVLFSEYFDRAEWKFKEEGGKWLSGMPSGLALTSKLNSWVN